MHFSWRDSESIMPSVGDSAELAARLRASRHAMMSEALQVELNLVATRPMSDEWSVLEVVAHMIDVDRHWLEQALAMRDKADHLFVHFDDAQWKEEHSAILEARWPDVLKAIDASHADVLGGLEQMTRSELARPGKHPRGIPYTVGDVFLRYPAHDESHARQIREIVEQLAR
jgi:uncharacterized damage-inducible protein DinB